VENVNDVIAAALRGMEVADQRKLDEKLNALDGTQNKSVLGANAILGVSMAACRARAAAEKKPLWQSLADQYGVALGKKVKLPVPMMNVINGGKHADSGLSFQECMIIPTGFTCFTDALRAGDEVFQRLKALLNDPKRPVVLLEDDAYAYVLP